MEIKYLLIVTAPSGLRILDTPRPIGRGAREVRPPVPVGTQLDAYGIHYIEGVPYARLVPLNPKRPEWVRVSEADGVTEYVDKIELDGGDPLARAIDHLADVLADIWKIR